MRFTRGVSGGIWWTGAGRGGFGFGFGPCSIARQDAQRHRLSFSAMLTGLTSCICFGFSGGICGK